MKQLTLTSVIDAFKDEPITIGKRLSLLGFSLEEMKKIFSEDLLDTSVYGSSFLKFLQDNSKKLVLEQIESNKIPSDFKNAFDGNTRSIGNRLEELGIRRKQTESIFNKEILDLKLDGEEFQQFLEENKEKFFGEIEKLASKGGVANG